MSQGATTATMQSAETQPHPPIVARPKMYRHYPKTAVQNQLLRYRWTGETFWAREADRLEREQYVLIMLMTALTLTSAIVVAAGIAYALH